MKKIGYEVYDIEIIFKIEENNIENSLDKALANTACDFDIKTIETDNDGRIVAKLLVNINCSWHHQDAYWDDYGGGTAEDETVYSNMDPYELQSYLRSNLNIDFISMEYKEFIEI